MLPSLTLSIYGSFSHFSGKTTEKEIKLLHASNLLKFFIKRKLLKKDLKFQLAHISGKNPKIKDNKIQFFNNSAGYKEKTKHVTTHRNDYYSSTTKF